MCSVDFLRVSTKRLCAGVIRIARFIQYTWIATAEFQEFCELLAIPYTREAPIDIYLSDWGQADGAKTHSVHRRPVMRS